MTITNVPASGQTEIHEFTSELLTIWSQKPYADIIEAIETRLPRLNIPRLFELVAAGDDTAFQDYVAGLPGPFTIFWELEQGTAMRLGGIPLESKFYLVGNPVIARGLFQYTGASGLGAPVRVNVSQQDGEPTRIDVERPSAFFARFPELAPSTVPGELDAKLIPVFQDIAGR